MPIDYFEDVGVELFHLKQDLAERRFQMMSQNNPGSTAPQCGKGKDVYPCPLPCIAGWYDTKRNF